MARAENEEGLDTKTHGEFNVVQFFIDESYEYVARWIGPEEAVQIAHRMTTSVGAKIGTTQRVIITDGGDFTNFEWEFGKGVVFPPPEETKR
jgi:hypothetical protein